MHTRTAALLALLLAAPASAQEWTRFRGPNGTGHGKGDAIPTSFADKDHNWRTRLPGGGHGSPVLWGDKLFVNCGNKGGFRMLVCLHADTGKVLWTKQFQDERNKHHKYNSFASGTPAADERHVYVNWATPGRNNLVAVDHAGEEVWRRDLGGFKSQHGSGTSPVVYGNTVVLANDQLGESFIVAVDRSTGKDVWRTPRRSGSKTAYGTPCVFRPPGELPQLIFNSAEHGITALDAATGKLVWEQDGIFNKRSVFSSITVAGLLVGSCGSGGGGNYIVAVKPGVKGVAPKVAYKITEAAPYVPTPVVKGELMFLINDKGVASCVKGATGEAVWRERLGANFFGSPVLVNDRIYVIDTKGTLHVLAASATFKPLAKVPLGEMSHATPAVARGQMYLRTFNHVISVGGKGGRS